MLETTIMISLIVGITEVFKRALKVPRRFLPLTSLVLGVGIALLFRGELPLIESMYVGLFVGLSSSGLYAGSKATIKG